MGQDQRIPPPLGHPPHPADPTSAGLARKLLTATVAGEESAGLGLGPPEILALVVANVVPIVGVALLGWRALPVAVYFLLELAIAGLFDLARLIRSEGDMLAYEEDPDRSPYATPPSKVSAVIAFIMVGTAALAFLAFAFYAVFTGPEADAAASVRGLLSVEGVALWQIPVCAALLIVAQERVYMRDFIGSGLYLSTRTQDVVVDFSGRFAFLFGVILIVVFLVDRGMSIDRSPLAGVIVLMTLKTIVDLWRLRRQRRKRLSDS